MGLFDMVQWDCPQCGADRSIVAQTKGGENMMDVLPADAVPIEAALDLDNWTACRACKAKYLVDFQRPPETVAVTIQYINDVDWDAFWRAENERR